MQEDPEHEDWKKNQYYQALENVASNLENYDSDKLIPMYGFGAVIPGGRDDRIPLYENKKGKMEMPKAWTSHCFAMNGNVADPQVKGVKGVLDAYMKTTPVVDMWGPTNFASFLR
jgi:hypothetical protein